MDIVHYMMNREDKVPFSQLKDGPITIESMKKSGVRLITCALYCDDKYNGDKSKEHLDEIINFTKENLKSLETIQKPSQIDSLLSHGDKLGKVLLLENADALADETKYMEELLKVGVYIIGLTHQGKNRLGDGNGVLYPDGLTDKGKEIIPIIIENGLILDVAHLHPRCFWELVKMTDSPIICSHTGVRKLFNTPRNIDFDMAKEILDRSGIIGVSFNPEMLSEEREFTTELIFSHLDTLVQKFGPDGICIGSDLLGFDMSDFPLDLNIFEELMDIMLKHGYGEKGGARILGLNLIEFYKRELPFG